MYAAHSEKQKEEIETNSIKFFQNIGVIYNENDKKCVKPSCNNKGMTITFRKRSSTSESKFINFRCKKCRTYQSIFDGSFFSLMRKRLFDIVLILKCWSLQLSIAKTVDYLVIDKISIDSKTIGIFC